MRGILSFTLIGKYCVNTRSIGWYRDMKAYCKLVCFKKFRHETVCLELDLYGVKIAPNVIPRKHKHLKM